jgi:hypothetical protein
MVTRLSRRLGQSSAPRHWGARRQARAWRSWTAQASGYTLPRLHKEESRN